MAKPGPKPGWKRTQADIQAQSAEAVAEPQAIAAEPGQAADPYAGISASDRENPNKLTGQPLRDLAHRRGIGRSTLATMSDDKIRSELRYITYRQYDDAVV